MTIKVSDKTEKIIGFVKSRIGGMSNVSAIEFLATSYLERVFEMYKDSTIADDDFWRLSAKDQFFKFLDEVDYKPLG